MSTIIKRIGPRFGILIDNLNKSNLTKIQQNSSTRNFNITSSSHIKKIGKHLIQEYDDQMIVLNLPFERDYLLPKYLMEENNATNLILTLYKANKSANEVLENRLKDVIENVNILNTRSSHWIKDTQETVFDKIANNFRKRDWSDKPTAKLFMIVPDNQTTILRSLFGQTAKFSGLLSKGRVEFYLLIPESEYKRIKSKTYGFLFDHEHFDTFAWTDLKTTKTINSKKNKCHFIKLTPKPSLAQLSMENRTEFIEFLSKVSVAKKSLMIAHLENWFPGIGLKLIDMNYSVFTKFGDLDTDDYVQIFDMLMREEKDAFIEVLKNKYNDHLDGQELSVEESIHDESELCNKNSQK